MFTSISSKIPQQHNLIAELSKLWISRSRIKVGLLCLELNEVELNDNIQILHIKLIIQLIDILCGLLWTNEVCKRGGRQAEMDQDRPASPG